MLALPFLLGICLPSLWSPLFSSCSRSDLPLSRQGGAVAHLDSLPPTIWFSGLTALFLFHLAKTALAYLSTALFVALRPLFTFSIGPVCSSFSAEVCAINFACSLLVSAAPTSLPLYFSSPIRLSFCHRHSVLPSTLSSLCHLSFHVKLCGKSGRNCLLSPVLSGYNGSLDIRLSRGTTRLMSWPDGALLAPSAIPRGLFPLISRIHSSLF